MFGKTVVLVVLALVFVTSCARPKYVEESAAHETPVHKVEAIADCATAFSESKYCLSWYWEIKPTSKQAGSLIFKVYRLNEFDKTPVVVDLAQVPDVVLWMSSMGHGSTPTKTSRLDTGTYRASNVFFIMPGDWDIRFLVRDSADATKTVDDARVAITI